MTACSIIRGLVGAEYDGWAMVGAKEDTKS